MTILTQAIDKLKEEQGENFSFEKINLAELQRLTGLSRAKLRLLKQNGFQIQPHGNTGKKHQFLTHTKISSTVCSVKASAILSLSSRV